MLVRSPPCWLAGVVLLGRSAPPRARRRRRPRRRRPVAGLVQGHVAAGPRPRLRTQPVGHRRRAGDRARLGARARGARRAGCRRSRATAPTRASTPPACSAATSRRPSDQWNANLALTVPLLAPLAWANDCARARQPRRRAGERRRRTPAARRRRGPRLPDGAAAAPRGRGRDAGRARRPSRTTTTPTRA